MRESALKILEMVRSLPPAEQQLIRAELGRGTHHPSRPRFQHTTDGRYLNPEGLPDDHPFFKILEEDEARRHRESGPIAPDFE